MLDLKSYIRSVSKKRENARGGRRATAWAAVCTAAAAFVPTGAAFAASPDGGGLIGLIGGLFSNGQALVAAIYYGFVSIAFVVCMVVIAKELIPAFFNGKNQDRVEFNGRVKAAVVAAAVLVALGLAPLFVPAAFDFFGATADVGFSAISGTSGN